MVYRPSAAGDHAGNMVTWILIMLGVVVVLALAFIAGGLLWGCIELNRM